MPSCSPGIERSQPLLGTRVALRVHGLEPAAAHAAIDAAFAEVAAVHALMSFHQPESDVSRLNREAALRPVRVDRRTHAVIARALDHSEASGAAFDVTVAPSLVGRGLLPVPEASGAPDPNADWRDIALLPDGAVAFRRPLWIDLGGIAKGYAVDRAVAVLLGRGASQVAANAGGDLRIAGGESERVALASGRHDPDAMPVIEIADGSIASSFGRMAGRRCTDALVHVDPSAGRGRSRARFVSVMAPECIDADALTKIVMARGAASAPCLKRRGAWAVVRDGRRGWRELGAAA